MKLLLIVAFTILSCGKFTYSPYIVKTQKLNLNERNMSRLSTTEISGVTDYKVAVISDTHDFYDELEEQVSYINSNDFDMTFISGDMTNTGLVDEYKQTINRLNRLNKPVFVTSGNHDLLIDGAKIYKDFFGPQDYSIEIGGTSFIFMNNNNWESDMRAPNVSWLEGELVKATGNRIVVIAHCPWNDHERFTKKQIADFKNLMEVYNVDYFINGHNHNPAEAEIEGSFTHITVGASSKRVLVELNVRSDGISHKHIKL